MPLLRQESKWSCICVLVTGSHLASFIDYSIAFWKCSDDVVYLVVRFISTDVSRVWHMRFRKFNLM